MVYCNFKVGLDVCLEFTNYPASSLFPIVVRSEKVKWLQVTKGESGRKVKTNDNQGLITALR